VAAYSALKRELALRYSVDIGAYTNSKTAFAERLLECVLADR